MNLRATLLGLLLLSQLAVPGWMIFEQERTLRHGAEYRFETEPLDPYDLFRGRYVALRFKAAEVERKGDLKFGQKVYVAVKPNAAGFAEIEQISLKPLSGENVFQATYRGSWSNRHRLEFPFNKYFMDETRAPAAEKAYRSANTRNSKQKAWAVVRIRNGKAALVDLVIDGQPIRDYLRAHPDPQKP